MFLLHAPSSFLRFFFQLNTYLKLDIEPLLMKLYFLLAADTPCSHDNGQCSHLCLLSWDKNFTCSCPDGLHLRKDGKTCQENDSSSSSVSTPTEEPTVNYTSYPSGRNVDKQVFQPDSKANLGLIAGLVGGLLLVVLLCFVVFFVAKKKRSPRLQ